jgi:hypothetical protein
VSNTGNTSVQAVNVWDDAGTPLDLSDDFRPAPALQPPATVVPLGTLERTYQGLAIARFAVHPTQPFVYASLPTQGAVEFASDAEAGNVESIAMHVAAGFEEAQRSVCFRMSIAP